MKSRLVQIGLALCALVVSLPTFATAQRTFVASTGVDTNPCSITLPCRSFAAAITQTISGGEVIVLDSAGYGPVTITQSVSIIAPAGIYAGISVPSTGNATGVAISGAAIKVVLRGLTINSTGGTFGISMNNGAELTIEDCVISNFPLDHYGVTIQTAAKVKISDTVVRDNGKGIVVGSGATVNIANSQVVNTTWEGIELWGGVSGTTTVVITDTLVNGAQWCIDNYASPGTTGNISATRVTVSGCINAIINEPEVGAGGTMTVSNSTVTGNNIGFENDSGTFYSLGNNHVSGNGMPTVGVITTIPLI